MPQDGRSSRAELETLLRKELESATERHESAKRHLLKVLDDLNQGVTTPPDGSYAVRQATLQETAARNEHMRVLKRFTELILYGKRPPDP